MSDSPSNADDVFDVERVKALIELMHEHELNEINLRQGSSRIKLRRGGPAVVQSVPVAAQAAPVVGAAPASTAGVPAPETAPAADDLIEIKCPMVGTFYVASSPDAAAYVKVGDQVGPETTVCMVEAMKVFNEVPAECSGTIAAVCVDNGEPVEFGQVLFRVRPV